MKIYSILFTIILGVLFSCKQDKKSVHFHPPHPDSIGVGTKEYSQGTKQANLDFKNDNSKFYLVGLINLDSLCAENMRKEFKSKYNIELSFEGCTGGGAYKNGYNNEIKNQFKKKYGFSFKNEIRKWTQ